MDDDDRKFLRQIARYQFGAAAGRALFRDGESLSVTYTSSGRPRQVRSDDGRLVTYNTVGRFTLGVAGGGRLQSATERPRHRVIVGDESEPYVREGRNVFAKFVQAVDDSIRPHDEVIVEHAGGDLLAVGRAELPGEGMADFETGMAVKVRDAVD